MVFLKRVSRIIKPYKLPYIAAIFSTALAAVFSLLTPLVVKITIDSVISGKPVDAPSAVIRFIEGLGGISVISQNLWICGVSIVLISVCEGIFIYLKGKLSAVSAENIANYLKNSLYEHIQKLPYGYHVKAQTGDIIQRCTSDVETVRKFLGTQVVEIARTVFIMIFSIYIMATIHVRLTVISTLIVPVVLVTAYIFFTKMKTHFSRCDQKEGELSAALQENLSGMRVVRAFGRQKYEIERFDKKNREYRGLTYNLIHMLALYWAISDMICFSQMLLVLVTGIKMTVAGELTLGGLIVFNSYEAMLLWPVRHLGRILSDMGKMEASLERIYEILDTPEETDTPGAVYHDLKGGISFKNVSFSYEEGKTVLQNISFDIKKGETIAVLGATGSGKSTIMHILLRLYDYSEGSIKINGRELRDINKKCLRENIGLVLQEPFLFSKTLENNMRMANDSATPEDIYSAAEVAAVHEAIMSFEKGYETMVGEKGVTLSGGQKQRVAIARTLIKNSSILIFDDSLSAVDTETDSRIRMALRERSKDITTFIISHRIATLMEADRIFVMEGGRMADCGTHDELISRESLYSKIWNIQNMPDFE